MQGLIEDWIVPMIVDEIIGLRRGNRGCERSQNEANLGKNEAAHDSTLFGADREGH